jgi:hypothetical protein
MAVTFVFRKKGKRTESGLSASFTLISDAGKKRISAFARMTIRNRATGP